MATIPAGYTATHNGLLYKSDGTGPYGIDAEGRIHALAQTIPLTDRQGVNSRLAVDQGNTHLLAGRVFRTFLEFNIASGGTAVIRITAPNEFNLIGQTLTVDDGHLRFSAVGGDGVAVGSFTTALPVVGLNRQLGRPTPYFEATLSAATGGTHTGGTELEIIRIRAAGATAQATTVGATTTDERLLPAGTFYLRLANIGAGAVTGVYTLVFEEQLVGGL